MSNTIQIFECTKAGPKRATENLQILTFEFVADITYTMDGDAYLLHKAHTVFARSIGGMVLVDRKLKMKEKKRRQMLQMREQSNVGKGHKNVCLFSQ